MFEDRKFRLLRKWSNTEIAQLAPLFEGDVINISGWDDRDKVGGCYRDYFSEASSYYITNFQGKRGVTGAANEIFLDLTEECPENLIERFDVCFNHTTLEHIFDVRKAFSNICKISRDIVFIVVPFSQTQHETESFGDYWRFTPTCLRSLFQDNGLDVVYEAQSSYKGAAIYLLFVGSKHPEKWHNVLPLYEEIRVAGSWIGNILFIKMMNSIINRVSISSK